MVQIAFANGLFRTINYSHSYVQLVDVDPTSILCWTVTWCVLCGEITIEELSICKKKREFCALWSTLLLWCCLKVHILCSGVSVFCFVNLVEMTNKHHAHTLSNGHTWVQTLEPASPCRGNCQSNQQWGIMGFLYDYEGQILFLLAVNWVMLDTSSCLLLFVKEHCCKQGLYTRITWDVWENICIAVC